MEQNKLTLGSLFDGSGGFPLGGLISGIVPLWASEIEPFPIRVTTKRLPFIKHYGDVSALSGAELPPVDIITFGSPCQDMSIAGKREGLDGNRSGLFYEAVRIVKEMRCATNGKYPRYIVWENVPGAFSSNKGEDFKAVLEAICKIKDEELSVPECKKWESAGEIVGDGFSVAWRVLDAQFWGVPQRRKRIFLVADFAGESAGQILFESEGLSGYSAEGFRSWQRTAGSAADRTGTASLCLNDQGGIAVVEGIPFTQNQRDEVRTLGDKSGALCKAATKQQTYIQGSMIGRKDENGPQGNGINEDVCFTLDTTDRHAVYAMTTGEYTQVCEEKSPTLMARDYKDPNAVVRSESEYTVRRLTPTECARLQGFPDWWCSDLGTENPSYGEVDFWTEIFETHRRIMGTSGKPKTQKQILKWLKDPYSDSAEYKLWGNGVALPCVHFVLSGIVYYSQFPTA